VELYSFLRIFAAFMSFAGLLMGQAFDPGVRGGSPWAGQPLAVLTGVELASFASFKNNFNQVEDVSHGLGPRFNMNSCGACQVYPATGGSSLLTNPQLALVTGP
jgi:hypothetical protein